MFTYGARNFHPRRTRNEKSAENGVNLWRRFLARVMGLSDVQHWMGQESAHSQFNHISPSAGTQVPA